MYKTQRENILKYLETGKAITPIEALNMFGCFRLAAVICDLKKEGHMIHTTTVKSNGKRFARYSLGDLFGD